MEIVIEIDEAFVDKIDPAPVTEALHQTNQQFNKGLRRASGMSLFIADEMTIRQLNQQHRGIDAPTDVLSFENRWDLDFPIGDPVASTHLGDIIIAYPVAAAQALSRGHSPLEEIVLLAVHGLLHLLGFDHDTPDHKKKMWAAQAQIMTGMGLGHVQPTED